jgi:hypothetical protein
VPPSFSLYVVVLGLVLTGFFVFLCLAELDAVFTPGFAHASSSYVEFVGRVMAGGKCERAGNMNCVAMHAYLVLSMVWASILERVVLFGIAFFCMFLIDRVYSR